MNKTLDVILAEHCGPVFFGKKPSALFPVPREQIAQDAFSLALASHALSYRVLCDRDRTALVLVYHPAMLARTLAQEQPRDTLRDLAYPGGGLDAQLDHLQARICGSATFPHEIGFFLGYPQEDVLGFIRHRGQHCKHCGLWKVYGDVSHAKTLFAEYRQCKHQLMRHVLNGGSLRELPAYHQHAG